MNFKNMERYLRVNLLGPGPRLMKNKITKVEKHCSTPLQHTSLLPSSTVAHFLYREAIRLSQAVYIKISPLFHTTEPSHKDRSSNYVGHIPTNALFIKVKPKVK